MSKSFHQSHSQVPAGFVAVVVPVNEQRPGPDLFTAGNWVVTLGFLGGHPSSHGLGEMQPPFRCAGLRVGRSSWRFLVGEDDRTRGLVERVNKV